MAYIAVALPWPLVQGYSHGLCSYGLCSYGAHWPLMQAGRYIVMTYVVMAYVVMALTGHSCRPRIFDGSTMEAAWADGAPHEPAHPVSGMHLHDWYRIWRPRHGVCCAEMGRVLATHSPADPLEPEWYDCIVMCSPERVCTWSGVRMDVCAHMCTGMLAGTCLFLSAGFIHSTSTEKQDVLQRFISCLAHVPQLRYLVRVVVDWRCESSVRTLRVHEDVGMRAWSSRARVLPELYGP